ncbi:hypothetical protein B0H13DRAFT_2525303 [Mycena leptocephala]|nr:hypothetical protein B0H13DRAFT_2525303 [Mycena leptocephala]
MDGYSVYIKADATNFSHIVEIVSILLAFWKPEKPRPIPDVIIDLLTRGHPDAVQNVLLRGGKITTYLWANFPITLSSDGMDGCLVSPDVLIALWRLVSIPVPILVPGDDSTLIGLEATFDALSQVESIFTHITYSTSIIPLIKLQITAAQSILAMEL